MNSGIDILNLNRNDYILFISYNPYYYPLSVEPVSVYYWLFAGILLKLPEISDKLEDEAGFPQKN